MKSQITPYGIAWRLEDHETLNPWKQVIQTVCSKVVMMMDEIDGDDGDGAAAFPPPWSLEKPKY